jgi:hypothetical protein
MASHTARRLRLDKAFRPERTKQETVMVDAVATRTAPSLREIQQGAPTSISPSEDRRSTAPVAMAPAAPDRNDAVILDLSEQARAVLAQASVGTHTPGASAEDLAGLLRFEERFKLMTEYTALNQELAFISGKTAAYALDKIFQGATAPEGERGGEAGRPAEIDRHLQRREELMPRYAELVRKLAALPGQES